ncbi:hypothetical protein HUO13_35360 [Saccharopolyspora erythraea]|uniref:hypothetical protein n=1 Tax=Saccharopolyspora erythraea TaxID=1836 RepID=UPI001BAA2737|nr:hypothetical protein [Saccharopolyspora erythraea]QUH05358.1 hypothetical protein HUO13_35360 [Saccharopolyspora erythraea]
MTRPNLRELAQMMRGVVLALGLAADDVERGRYDATERERLAGCLDRVSAALRNDAEQSSHLVIDSRAADR